MTTTTESLRSDKSGAVAVEFTVAVMPLFFIFFGFWQLFALYTADLAVRHGANAVVRAAVVIDHFDNPGTFVGSDSQSAIGPPYGLLGAFGIATSPWSIAPMVGGMGTGFSTPSLILTKVTVDHPNGNPDKTFNSNYNMTHAKVETIYLCTVPLGKRLACGSLIGNLIGINYVQITREASLPQQGARYDL
jgi:hypothetical protein